VCVHNCQQVLTICFCGSFGRKPQDKAKSWYARLYRQSAAYELKEDEVRQLLFDLESSYNEFISTIR
jgi:hypothetical protein